MPSLPFQPPPLTTPYSSYHHLPAPGGSLCRDIRRDPLIRMFGRSGVGQRDTTSAKLHERDRLIQEFVLGIKTRATSRAKIARKYQTIQTEDVVRDIMLPEFRFTLNLAIFRPVRRFGPVPRKVGVLGPCRWRRVRTCTPLMEGRGVIAPLKTGHGPPAQSG